MISAAIVHPTHLIGKELRETFERRAAKWGEVQLYSTLESEIGTVTDVGGAAAIILPFEAERLKGTSVVFFCGKIEEVRPLLADLPAGTTPILLSLDAAAEDGTPVVMGVNSSAAIPGRPLLSPHPAAVLLALALFPLQRHGIEEIVATLVQPASIYGEAGLEELFGQTRGIVALSSRGPSPVFGAQLSFNLLPAAQSVEPIAAQLSNLLDGLPTPRLQLLQGGVFHAVSGSVFVRFREPVAAAAVRKSLAGHPHVEAAPKPRLFGPIDAAGSPNLLFGAPRQDGADGVWLWLALDNLTRGGALNAIEIAEAIA